MEDYRTELMSQCGGVQCSNCPLEDTDKCPAVILFGGLIRLLDKKKTNKETGEIPHRTFKMEKVIYKSKQEIAQDRADGGFTFAKEKRVAKL